MSEIIYHGSNMEVANHVLFRMDFTRIFMWMG